MPTIWMKFGQVHKTFESVAEWPQAAVIQNECVPSISLTQQGLRGQRALELIDTGLPGVGECGADPGAIVGPTLRKWCDQRMNLTHAIVWS